MTRSVGRAGRGGVGREEGLDVRVELGAKGRCVNATVLMGLD